MIKKLKAIVLLIGIYYCPEGLIAQQKIGIFDNHTDIGQVKHAGFASYDKNNQTYLVGGAGSNMWFNKDEFHYLWTTVQGDFIVRAEIELIGKGVDPHRKVGWIVKNNLDNDTKHVNAVVHGDGLTSLQYRKNVNGNTLDLLSSQKAPDVIQLERKGNQYIMSTAKFGEPFTSVTLDSVQLDNEVYVGIYVCSHSADIIESAKFRNVRIIKPADEGFKPYQDYIGSRLEVMDVATGHRKVLQSTSHSIQAPNWTNDGTKMIYNSKGRLFQYELETSQITPLETGFAINNNNDHVLTFKGDKIGISNHTKDEGWNSTLYYLSVKGSPEPIRVTKPNAGASYLHGWSPDERKMIFTAERKDQYDLYSVEVATGKETQLTNFKTLDDGSEYSPDGKYIYFNSARTGKMKLWRMDPDGKNQTQLTFDEYNDWFPHISPDKKWIVFISFPKDIPAGDHPFYKQCLIRLMPYEGGTSKVIGYIYGGQGTINVPSWSPDSKKIAFITNSKIK